MNQPVPLNYDQVPPSTNQYCPIVTQHHQILGSTAFYWPSTIMYQPVPLHTDPVPPSTNQYHLLLSIKISLFFFSSVKNIFPFSGYYPPFPSPFIVRSAKNIFFLHIFSSFFFLVDLRWAQLYVSLVSKDFPKFVFFNKKMFDRVSHRGGRWGLATVTLHIC